MKRTLCLLLAALLLIALPAMADAVPLDAAFNAGALNLVPVTWEGLARIERAEIPPMFWAFAEAPEGGIDTAAEMLLSIKNDIQPVSISPDGESAIGVYSDTVITISDGVMRPLAPSALSLAGDTYGNFAKLITMPPNRLVGTEGLVWSPDGRYAMPLNWNMVMQNGQLMYDPMILDTQTGEIRLVATYAGRPIDDNSGAPISAVFSEDSTALYFTLYGHAFGEGAGAIARADLANGDIAPAYVYPLGILPDVYPHLARVGKDRFALLTDNRDWHLAQGIALFVPSGDGEYIRTVTHHALPMVNVFFNRLLGGTADGGAVAYGDSYIEKLSFDHGVEGVDELYGIDRETGLLKPIDQSTAANYNPRMTTSSASAPGSAPADPGVTAIGHATLSPDGRYLLVTSYTSGANYVTLVRLEDMASVPVNGMALPELPMLEWMLSWSEAGILMTTTNGAGVLYNVQ